MGGGGPGGGVTPGGDSLPRITLVVPASAGSITAKARTNERLPTNVDKLAMFIMGEF
jgi:hypothetical protein